MIWHSLLRFGLALAWEVFWRAIVPAGMALGVVAVAILAVTEACRD